MDGFTAVVAAAALATVANAASCDVTSLQTLLTSSDTTTCATDSGYAVTSLATPTDAEKAIMCTSTACQSVLKQLETLAPSECTLGTFALYADLITPLTEYCSGGGSTAGSSATTTTVGSTAGSSTNATVTTSSTGSAAATPTTTSTTSSGSSTQQTTTSSSSASAAASASTSGSSGASMAAVSAGAVLAAVAATFF
ncbi:hypothetical protein BBO99_00008499 [Phytophthora kernoviae]|uniref:Elicitin n=2 Tax=Phytophthora kernoviae TaxID=325452 RepID=A0A3R7J3R7_9STRA|nr:hypothetical protein G195_010030 [Phytophthora kernoviae 00238/432]KAG2510857.1 hypothetical protein JM16_008376 [Phytophthora kernoviae]KAG2514165.1 hypothetical protein JM18_008386 [Phytophthora kernoviae]RLN14819.1 hypothetical protein BBI17_008514 [Phytophthora kernoviae]RLN75202.1 hypothetical protein BBO99_00008499 [Phytophthora kernoviae]